MQIVGLFIYSGIGSISGRRKQIALAASQNTNIGKREGGKLAAYLEFFLEFSQFLIPIDSIFIHFLKYSFGNWIFFLITSIQK